MFLSTCGGGLHLYFLSRESVQPTLFPKSVAMKNNDDPRPPKPGIACRYNSSIPPPTPLSPLPQGLLIPMFVCVYVCVCSCLVANDQVIVEWRALTVCLLDEVAAALRKKLGKSEEEFPLVKVGG